MSNKKLEKLEVAKTSCVKLGPYTITEVICKDGIKGWGLAVKSYADRENPTLGEQISKGRAQKAVLRKLNKEKFRQQDIFSR